MNPLPSGREILLPTPGPWRWEFNRKHKSISLQGGERPFDLTVMDFSRWGTHGAVPSLRDPGIDGMNVMNRLCDRPDWITHFAGREHHADWCADVTHPDMRLIAASPALLEACEGLLSLIRHNAPELSGKMMGFAQAAVDQAKGTR